MSRRKPLKRDNLPATIRIGVFRYALEHWDPLEAEQQGCYGNCDRFAKIIRVRTDITDESFAETLEHEIMHACWDASGLKSRAGEERVVSLLTPILMMARRDNPDLYAWIDSVMAKA
jgi:hypothetical protein